MPWSNTPVQVGRLRRPKVVIHILCVLRALKRTQNTQNVYYRIIKADKPSLRALSYCRLYVSFAYRCCPLPEWGLLLIDAVGALIFQAQREMAFVRKQEQTPGNAPIASLLDLSSSSIVLEEDMLSALLLMQDSGSAEMSYLRQMQNSFAGELSLQ